MVKTLTVLATLLIFNSQAVFAADEQIPAPERQKIEDLIGTVEKLQDAQFIRNGKCYSAAAAARFLRGKWKAQSSEVRSAEEFIEKVGSFSSTTGKSYSIRFADGKETPSDQFLRSLLAPQSRRP